MTFRPVLAAILVSLTLPATAAGQDRTASDYISAIEGVQETDGPNDLGRLTIDGLLEEFGVPGVSVAVIHDFQVHWAKGYGVRDVETGEPVDTETMFQAASISKPVTAMAVLEAVEDGLFTLDTDINDILTSWTLDGGGFTDERPVTPRTLHSHTSGLGDGFGYPGYDPGDPIPTVVQMLNGEEPSNTRAVFMEREPMTFAEYSGGGVTVMQLALADARGRPFEEIMREDVLEPIGMTRSSFKQPISPENDRNAARAHDGQGRSRGAKWHVYPEMAAAGLWTTATDLARFAIEVQKSSVGESNRVLSRTTVQEMLSPVGVGDFAVGFVVGHEGEGWYFSHGGGNWGFRCTLVAHKVKGYGLAIMTNADRGGAVMGEIARRVRNAYEWDWDSEGVPRGYDPIPEREEIEVSEEILETYVGVYELGDDGLQLTVSLEDGLLQLQPDGQQSLTLHAETEERFFMRTASALITFTKDDAGEVTGMMIAQGGGNSVARKVR
ncbi:MAG: serine hydrolase domain-containing protein [Gemmatimonadota bacterium]|nr:serine hydrolase domain-containing protein [Gemmatimonadota bacterium]